MHRSTFLLVALAVAGCQPGFEGPAPRVDTVEPNFMCHAQRESTLTVRGDGFAPSVTDALSREPELTAPTLELTMEADLFGGPAVSLQLPVSGDDVLWISEIELEVTLQPDLAWLDGVYGITLTNPDGQDSYRSRAVVAAPPPTVYATSPTLTCLAQDDARVDVTGEGFLVLLDAAPAVTIGGWTAPRADPSVCTPVMGPVASESCATLTVTVPQDLLDTGIFDVTVANPAPTDCVSSEPVALVVVAAPDLVGIEPTRLCSEAGDTRFTLTGGNLLVIDDVPPTVTVDGNPIAVIAADGCADLEGLKGAQLCTGLTVGASVGAWTAGEHLVQVTNPVPADCASGVARFTLDVLPTLSGIDPDHVCESGGTFTLSGTDLADYAVISVDGVEVSSVKYVDSTAIEVTLAGGLKPGEHEITLVQGTCQATLKKTLEVLAAPLVLSVDPPTVGNVKTTDVTLAISGITGELTGVWLVSVADASVTDVAYVWDDDTPDTATAVIPSGLPVGWYDVYIELDDNCPGFLPAGLEVVK